MPALPNIMIGGKAPSDPQKATLRMPDGTELEFPVLHDADGGVFVDIRKLQPTWVTQLRLASRGRFRARPTSVPCCFDTLGAPGADRCAPDTYTPDMPLRCSTGICTFDPGFGSTAACESTITYIDGNKGVLLYRGCARPAALAPPRLRQRAACDSAPLGRCPDASF
jgi:hypothetical protein